MTANLTAVLCDSIPGNPDFLSAVFSGRLRGPLNGQPAHNNAQGNTLAHEWERVVIKPVLLKTVLHYSFTYYDATKSTTKNYVAAAARAELAHLATRGFKSIYVRDTHKGLQIQINKKGKLFVKRHAETNAPPASLAHDRVKNKIIAHTPEDAYLQALGFLDGKGQVKPTMQAKLKQINEFVKLLADLQDWSLHDGPVRLIDCGSGNAYLTFAAYHYFRNVLGKETCMIGLDINPELVENSTRRARDLGWDGLTFDVANIGGYTPETAPTIVLALHACDTATDEALMKAVQWDAAYILSVPCCHHDLQKRLKDAGRNAVFAATFKHGILRERLGDILTDTLRAALLEIMGYKTDVIQFVTTEHTARNLMIRAKRVSRTPLDGAVDAYQALTAFWQVTPVLDDMLDRAQLKAPF